MDEEEDFYSPVVKMPTLKTFLSIACCNRWYIEQLDVQTAFLNGPIKSEVYVKQPDGYSNNQRKVYRLQKALYGLRESPLCWFQCLDQYLKVLGFTNFKIDSCLYSLKYNGHSIYLLVYVDDLLICGSDIDLINTIKSKLSLKFCMKLLGPVSNYLGIQIEYDRESGVMKLNQRRYIE